MKYSGLKILAAIFVIGVCIVGVPVFAQDVNSSGGLGPNSGSGLFGGSNSQGGVGPNSGAGCGNGTQGTFVLCNPLAVDNFCDLIKSLLGIVLGFGVPIAVLFLVWAGFRFILARGRPVELEAAKKNFIYVIVGIAVFLGAWTLASVISATIKQLDKNGTIKVCSTR